MEPPDPADVPMATSAAGESPRFGDARDDIVTRAAASQLLYEITANGDGGHRLSLTIPNGRSSRTMVVGIPRAERLRACEFENWSFLADYEAILNKAARSIEADIQIVGMPRILVLRALRRVSNFEIEPGDQAQLEFLSLTQDDEPERGLILASPRSWDIEESDSWRIRTYNSDESLMIELSPYSPTMLTLDLRNIRRTDQGLGRTISLKITGRSVPVRHDDAVNLLREVGDCLFFELDLTHGIQLELAKSRFLRPSPNRSYAVGRDSAPVNFPRRKYAREGMSLYMYGRSARGVPLLEFLAYYQAVEFFFPMFSRRDIVARVRNILIDPRLDVTDESAIGRLIDIASASGQGSLSEREQLRITLASCVENEELRDFISSSPEREEFLTGKQKLKDVPSIHFSDSSNPLVTQLAKRMYSIRCRIVHSKDNSGPNSGAVLLPNSDEAFKLGHDIDIARFVAQKVIVGSSTSHRW